MLDALRKMETLKVSEGGAISVSPSEVVKRKDFVEAKMNIVKAIEGSKLWQVKWN